MDERTKQLRARAKPLVPIVNVGKKGLTPGVIELIDRELRDKHLIKIKMLKGALPEDVKKADRKGLAAQVAQATRSSVIEQVGSVVVLWRER
jgi:RNA-binding protein